MRLPEGSFINSYLQLARFMEAPYSYILATCLSGVSCLLRRQVWFELEESGVVLPNASIILIGPSGIGKDTSINMGMRRILKPFMPNHRISGITAEAMAANLHYIADSLGEDPACGYILANEMKQLFGGKDYQGGMIELLTHLLSDLDEHVHGTKHEPLVIPHPTVVLQAGTTEEWFHRLPADALEGGFIPRCLVIYASAARQMLPFPADWMDAEDRRRKDEASKHFSQGVEKMLERVSKPQEMYFADEAKDLYGNWYCNRFKALGPFAQGYANRSRGHIIRLAMLSAISRDRVMLDLQDVEFALGFMEELLQGLERVILPPTPEARCCREIKKLLPLSQGELVIALRPKFTSGEVQRALLVMRDTGEVDIDKLVWYNK